MNHNPLAPGCGSVKSAQKLPAREFFFPRGWNLGDEQDLDIPRPGVAAILPVVQNNLLDRDRRLLSIVDGLPWDALCIRVAEAVVGISKVGRGLNDVVDAIVRTKSCCVYCRGRHTGLAG